MNRWKGLCALQFVLILFLVAYTASAQVQEVVLQPGESVTVRAALVATATPTLVAPPPSPTQLPPTATPTSTPPPTGQCATSGTVNIVNRSDVTLAPPEGYSCLKITGCVWVSNSNNILIDRVEVSQCGTDGISVSGGSNVTVQNSYVHDLNKRGIHTNNVKNVRVLNNRIENLSEGSAINVWADSRRSLNFTVSGNTIKNVGANLSDGAIENGISIYRVDGGLIENNTVSNAQMGGVRVNGGSQITIRGNTLLQDRRLAQPFRAAAGVYIETVCGCGPSTDNLVEGNTIRDSDVGIEVTNLNNGTTRTTLRNNLIADNLYVGVYFEGDGLIENNQIGSNPTGLEMHFGGTSVVRGNLFFENNRHVLLNGGSISNNWQVENNFQ